MEQLYETIEHQINDAKEKFQDGRIVSSIVECRKINTQLANLLYMSNERYRQITQGSSEKGPVETSEGSGDLPDSSDRVAALQERIAKTQLQVNEIIDDAEKYFSKVYEESIVYKWRNPEDPPFMHEMLMGYGRFVAKEGNLAYIQPFEMDDDGLVKWKDESKKRPANDSLDEVLDSQQMGDNIIISSEISEDPLTLFNVGTYKYMMAYKLLAETSYEVPGFMKKSLPIIF